MSVPTSAADPDLATTSTGADEEICLCLSGGGFRATLFHLGGLLRLNELGVLPRLAAIVSVSGGSILNGVLATRWERLRLGTNGTFENLAEEVAEPVRHFCATDLRTPLLVGTRLKPANWPALIRDRLSVSANFLAQAYEPLYRSQLADLPRSGSGTPRFIFCATSVADGACWQFHGGPGGRMGDFYTGYCEARNVRVSTAVAASSAFPPGFSGLRLKLPDHCQLSRLDPWGKERPVSGKRETGRLGGEPVLLTDGGVYDNLGVEPVWNGHRPLLVSDAGAPFRAGVGAGQSLPARLKRAGEISMEQVAAVRKRWLVEQFQREDRLGALWTLNTRIEDFPTNARRGYGAEVREMLHAVRTDLNGFSPAEMGCLQNHGYALADAAVRSRAPALFSAPAPRFRWPDEEWCDDASLVMALRGSHRRRLLQDTARYLVGQR